MITLDITKGNEHYSFDNDTGEMVGTGPELDFLNMVINSGQIGDNPFRLIADLLQPQGYTVKLVIDTDKDELDGIV
jgi:hypothetical protein